MFGARRRPTLPETVDVDLDGRPVVVAVRSPPHATRYALRVPGDVSPPVLTIPPRGSWSAALRFLDRHRPWLAQRLASRPDGVPFVDGAIVPVRGLDHVIRHVEDRGAARLRKTPEPMILVGGDPAHLERRVSDLLKREARRLLLAASERHAARLGVTFSGLTIKDTRSRWGSCSAARHLSYSWRIVFAPDAVINYLAAHEVAHLKHMDHSVRFWRTVERLCPDWRQQRDWLRRHSAELHRYGV